MRSKKRTIGILIFIVLISIISGVLIISQKNKEESIYSEDVYSYVDDIIKDTVSSDNYLNADINEKYKIINKTLNSLEKENKILSNSIEYDSENKIFWYNYSDGTEGGIMLENFAEGYSGNANIDNYVVRKDEQGKILSYNCDIDFNSNEYPYTAKEVESLDLKAKFMYGLGFDSILDEYKKYQTIWIKQYLKTDIDDYCTVEDFKSGLSGYNIVFIEEHGCYSNKKIMICTEELTSKKSDSNYKVDLKDKRIKKVINAENNKQYYWINPSFFSFYYKDNELSNTVIWIGSCHGYQCDDLVNAFSRCGAKAVIGYDESVLTGYDCVMLNPFVYSLLYGDSVSEALNFAKSIFGQNDLEYWRTYRGTTSKFGTIALMPSGKNNCATAKLYPENENARLIDAEIIGAQRGGEIKSKTQSTEPVEITEIPTEPTTQTSAIDLIDKTLPEIISLMNGEYQIIKTENDGYIYIQNQSVLSGMEFYIQVSGDDIISANNGEEIHNDTLKAKLESGELTLDGIQVNKSGKVSETIQADMDYKSCSKVLGDFNCIGGTGGYLGGDVSSLSYYYNDKNAKVILNFNIPGEIYKDLILGKISSVSSEEMKSYNPNLRNVVIRKVETVTTMQTEAKENLIELVPSGKISCYGEHRGAITNNGDLYLWGNNSDGQLGTVTDEFIKVYWDKNGISSTPIKVMENVACASLGYDTSAVITNDGSLYTWGCGRYGRLGNGDDDNSIEPIKIMDNAVSVSLGFEAGAVITNDSSLFVWGYNLYGLGNGDSGPFKSPVKIMDNVKKVKLGGDNGAVITNDDVLYIWGSNIWGQLGNGETTDNMKSPVQVMDKVKDISFGDYYCAILSNSGDIYICGRIVTNKGVIGTASVPTKLEISQQAKEISCCGNTIYFIGEDNCLYEMVKHNSPVKIMENVNCISSNVAITNDGCMYTWGSNEYGQLGNGTTEDSEEPIKIMDGVMLKE